MLPLTKKWRLDIVMLLLCCLALASKYYEYNNIIKAKMFQVEARTVKELNHQAKILNYIEKKINSSRSLPNKKLAEILSNVEDTFYNFQSLGNLFPSSIGIVLGEPINKIITSQGETSIKQLAPDLDYYLNCKISKSGYQLSMPYKQPNIEDLYVIHLGKSLRTGNLDSCIDMRYSLDIFLKTVLSDFIKNSHNKYILYNKGSGKALEINKNKINYIDYNQPDSNSVILDKKSNLYLAIKVELREAIAYIVSNTAKVLFYSLIIYLVLLLSKLFIYTCIRSYIIKQFRGVIQLLSLNPKKIEQSKSYIIKFSALLRFNISKLIKARSNLLEENSLLKKNIIELKAKINSLKKYKDELELTNSYLGVEKYYGDLFSKYIREESVLLMQKLKILIENFSQDLDFKLSNDKIVNILEGISVDIEALKSSITSLSVLDASINDLISDSIKLNQIQAFKKNIKIFNKVKDTKFLFRSNSIAILKSISSVINKLINASPKDANIYIRVFKDESKIIVQIRDDSFGYLDLENIDKDKPSNLFDIRDSSWHDIKVLAHSFAGIVNVKNIQYEGNIVEIVIPILLPEPTAKYQKIKSFVSS